MKTKTPISPAPFIANKDQTFIINLVFTPEEIAKTYSHTISSAQSEISIKGFRKGKAPTNIVKDHLSESRIIEEVLTSLVTKAYGTAIETNHLHPIIQPQVKILNPPLDLNNKEWQIELTGCQLPLIKLDSKYQDEIKKINKSAKNDNDRINETINHLIKQSTVEIPELLIKSDLDNKLAQLVDQTKDAGMSVSDYLKSKNLNLEKYQENLRQQIIAEWTTNLAIDNIAKTNELTVSDQEVDQIVSKNKQMANNLNLVYYLLTQQKVFEFLKNL
jgi:FKBP-type peptidyl-prolyl cis-trans isomerase (trigger factor)